VLAPRGASPKDPPTGTDARHDCFGGGEGMEGGTAAAPRRRLGRCPHGPPLGLKTHPPRPRLRYAATSGVVGTNIGTHAQHTRTAGRAHAS